MSTRLALLTITAVLVAMLGGLLACTSDKTSPAPGEGSPVPGGGRLRVATTTSLYDTGLWDYLGPLFEERYGVRLDVIYAGTGKALEYGKRGDVDVVTIHSKAREERFVAEGHGLKRHVIAYNYFLIVGPESDPAGIKGMSSEEAFLEVMKHGQANPGKVWFVSRGDKSGTHDREIRIWQRAGREYEAVRNSGRWYLELGTGMGPTLMLANEKSAYTLSDIGTYLAFKPRMSLVPLVEGEDALLNVYSAIAVNPERHPNVNAAMADALIRFLTSEEIQELIGEYGINKYGAPLFTPARGHDPSE